jgi:hypothetical protein
LGACAAQANGHFCRIVWLEAGTQRACRSVIRLFLLNGRPLERDGKFAAFRRVPAKGDVRSNIHAQGTAEPVNVTDKVLKIAEVVRPKLVQDGMFLVGLDIVGDKILEINVFTPGGLWSISQIYEADFVETVTEGPVMLDPEFRSILSALVDDGQAVVGGESHDKLQKLTVRKRAINEQRADGKRGTCRRDRPQIVSS